MYEKFNGSDRLLRALENAVSDDYTLSQLANILFYCDDQLPQDVQALADCYKEYLDSSV